MQRIAVLTSGGDAPGMNAAIRAVVRSGLHHGFEVFGVRRGFRGLLDDDLSQLGTRDVSSILQRGGTSLRSARCPEFADAAAQAKAIAQLRARGIEGLVVIGGNGSQQGSHALSQAGLAVVGVASTIDNDLYGADISIGVDTALNVALSAVDKLKVTAASHRRASLIEIMGRDCGYLALMVGLAGGAEAIVIPEVEMTPEQVADEIREAHERGKSHALVVVAEGAAHDAKALQAYLGPREAELGFDLRVTVLGHIQRGGTPTAFDRLLGTRLGAAAVTQLAAENAGVLVGWRNGRIETTPLDEVVSNTKTLDRSLFELGQIMDR
jgi:6-phosphofructokinase 1